MHSIALKTGLATVTVLLLAACSSSQTRYNDARYHDNSNYRTQCDRCGTIERIEKVRLRDQHQDIGAGAVLGAIIGGVAGNQINTRDHQTAAIAAGAVAGGVIGHEIQKNNSKQKNGYQFDVRLEDGRWAQVTQLEKRGLRVGNFVMVRDHELQLMR
ncbi:MAG: glycine zipper 2TM domain-containing protein [Steroidobacteraceae bacterium]